MNGYLFFQLSGNISHVDDYLRKDFGKILKSAGLEARRWMKNTDSTAARVYDRNLEELPVTVDLYGDWARIVDYSDEEMSESEKAEIEDIVSRYLYVESSRIVSVFRRKREGKEQHVKGDEECPVTVRENGLVFECELRKYTDTGLFLDMAEARAMVREMARNERVLNLFSYTSSFSVYAAAGNAESVTSVDLSNVYSEWGRRNLTANGFLDEEKYSTVTSDVREFLRKAAGEKKVWDLVILDPPAFSNSHKAEDFDVQKDHVELLTSVYDVLSDGGVVLFSENLSGFRFDNKSVSVLYTPQELTSSLFALNFSHKRKSCRVWVLKKNSGRKRERKERKMSEDLERFSLDLDEGKEEKKRERKEARSFSFDGNEDSPKKDFSSREGGEGRERRENRPSRYSDRKSRYSDDRRGERESRPRYEKRDDEYRGRSYRGGERRNGDGKGWNDERRNDRYDGASYSRQSRYSDRNEDYRGRSSRYDDDRYGERREERRNRYDDAPRGRRESYNDDRRRESRPERSYRRDSSDDWRNGREYSKKEEHSSFARRSGDGSRSSYKRSSYSSGNRYQEDRDERRREERKKSSPKPFGYDSFMANKNREGATADWLKDQEYIDKDND